MRTPMVAVAALLAAMGAFAQDAEIVKVKGRGVGADKTEALKDAYRDAVERAVGLYVDAEQMMKNEELVKDQILTQSNAYIEKYDVAKETAKPNGLVEVQILAEVRTTALTKKISDVMPTKTFRLSDGLKNDHAKMTTVEKRNVDGAALLKKALEDFDPLETAVDCSLASEKAVVGRLSQRRDSPGESTTSVNYLFKVEMNQERFFGSVAKLAELLDNISVEAPVDVSIPAERMRSLSTGDDTVDIAKMLANAKKVVEGGRGAGVARVMLRQTESINIKLPEVSADRNAAVVLIVTGANKYRSIYHGKVYKIDIDAAKVFRDWQIGYERKYHTHSPTFRITFLDSAGDSIATETLHSGVRNRGWICSGKFVPWLDSGGRGRGNRAVKAEYFWGSFSLPKDALPEVKDMKIEIVK